MKKVFSLIAISVVTVMLFLNGASFDTQEKWVIQEVSDYPNMKLIMADGSIKSALSLPPKSIIVIFFPDCDHCQREATEISNHITAFDKYQVWFIATSPYAEIQKFAIQYKLMGHKNIHFVRTEVPDILQNFGGIPTPSVFIYSSEKKLVKALKGETKIEEILKHL